MEKEYEELGLIVTKEELFELIQGVNPHPQIKQYFADPNTGIYDRRLIVQYLQNFDNMPPESKQQWIQFEKFIKDDRLRQKYNGLITQGYYVPVALAKLNYEDDNTTAKIAYVAARYQDIPDSTITITDEDYADYYEENKEIFKEKTTCDISYVLFEVKPSMKDMQSAKEEMDAIYNEYKETNDVARFVKLNSDNRYDSSWKTEGQLPLQIDTAMFSGEIGTVTKPYLENEEFHIARLVDVAYRPDSMKASHILIAYQGALRANPEIQRTKDQAEQLADSLLGIVKRSPKKMETLIASFSDDPTAEQNKGDMGWFADGAMVWQFNEAVLKTKTGGITFAETPFGYHIIDVTGKKDDVKKVKVAMVDRTVLASNETYQQTFAKASKLASENKTEAEFNDAVTEGRFNKRSMPKVDEMSNYIAGLNSPRQIVRWAFNEETGVGDVSQVFDLEDMFVVAVVTAKSDGGYPPLSTDGALQKIGDSLLTLYFAGLPTVQSGEHIRIFDDSMREQLKEIGLDYDQLSPMIKSGKMFKGCTITGCIFTKKGVHDMAVIETIQDKVLKSYTKVLAAPPCPCPIEQWSNMIMGPQADFEYHLFKEWGFDVPLSAQKAFFTMLVGPRSCYLNSNEELEKLKSIVKLAGG